MPSITAELEKRIEQLEHDVAAHERKLKKLDPGAAARETSRHFVALWHAVEHFFETAGEHDVRWDVHPDVSAAYQRIADVMLQDPNPTERRQPR